MGRRSRNRSKNTQNKLATQTKQAVVPETGTEKGAPGFSTDDIDKIATWLTVIFGAAGGLVLLGGHNYIALWLGFATICCCITALIGYLKERMLLPRIVAGRPWLLCMMASVLLAMLTARIHWQWLNESTNGVLFDGAAATTSDINNGVDDGDMAVFLGNCRTFTNANKMSVVRVRGEDLFKVERKNHTMLISAILLDPSGGTICDIVENRYRLNQPDLFKITSARHRFTLADITGKTLLTMELIDRRTLQVTGQFFLRNGTPMVIEANTVQAGGTVVHGGTIILHGSKDPVIINLN